MEENKNQPEQTPQQTDQPALADTNVPPVESKVQANWYLPKKIAISILAVCTIITTTAFLMITGKV